MIFLNGVDGKRYGVNPEHIQYAWEDGANRLTIRFINGEMASYATNLQNLSLDVANWRRSGG